MKEKKKLPARLQVGQRGERKNIANNYKVRSRNNETPKNKGVRWKNIANNCKVRSRNNETPKNKGVRWQLCSLNQISLFVYLFLKK